MRHHTAAQKGEGGGWHYVSLGRDGGYPLGACAGHEPHATEAEARCCYRAWEREQIRLDQRFEWTGCRISGCDKPTRQGARIADGDGYHHAPLCADHLTTEDAIIALQLVNDAAGDAWQS